MRQLSLTSLLSLGLVTALLVGCNDQPTATATQVPSVSVTGSASIMVAPDQFIIRAAAVEEGKDVKALSSLANQKTNQVIELATSLGIDKKDIKALSLQVTPQWNYQPSRHLTGYQARRDITITLDSMDNYAALLEGLIDIGITDIGQTQAQVSNSKELAIDALADAVLSTGGMMLYARQTDARQIIIGTETGIIHRLQKENPDKEFIPAMPQAICTDMKLITQKKVLSCLEKMAPRVTVPEDVRIKAKSAVERMLQAV